MDFKGVLKNRRSIRQYRHEPVPDHMVAAIIEQAKRGPSAGGVRGYGFVVTEQQLTSYIAPIHIVVYAIPEKYYPRYGNRGRDLYAIQDATIAGAYLQLAAVDAGLATVWVGAFKESRIKKSLVLGDEMKPIAIFPLGYAA